MPHISICIFDVFKFNVIKISNVIESSNENNVISEPSALPFHTFKFQQ